MQNQKCAQGKNAMSVYFLRCVNSRGPVLSALYGKNIGIVQFDRSRIFLL